MLCRVIIVLVYVAVSWVNDGEAKPFVLSDQDRAYWAFQPVRTVVGSIDGIVASALVEQGLTPNPSADRVTLIRRVYVGLLGLPPSYVETQDFVGDSHPLAYERLIDRLLASPAYGERWGRHWLDVVRFAQTNGYERDDEKPDSWKYRDYVINAFNDDKPYDRFVMEQIAGDELSGGGEEALIATGFYRLGVHDDEPDDAQAAEFEGLDDMLKTTTETFMGLTLGCARCHDHMFDPVSQRDYYELLAFFRNVRPYSQEGRAMVVSERGSEAAETRLLLRGEAGRPGEAVEPRFPEVFAVSPPQCKATDHSSGRRLALAQWISDASHPLTARVMANRVWQGHFGRGIVATPNDFGKAGEGPTNHALLDFLATELVRGTWSIKRLTRLILLSDTYQRGSMSNAHNENVDPGNRFLWRQNMRRGDAEVIRDAVLKVSGTLRESAGGDRGFYPSVSGEVVAAASRPGRGWGWSSPQDQNRRSVYAFVKRTMLYPFFEIFDYANTEGSLGRRPVTTVSPQALLLLNGEVIEAAAGNLANQLVPREDAIGELFRRILARNPSSEERLRAQRYLNDRMAHYVELDQQVVFLPDYATALFEDYRTVLPAERFLRGPEDGSWLYFKGRWGDAYEGIVNSDSERPPFALHRSMARDYILNGTLALSEATSRAAIFLRTQAKADQAEGYEYLVDAEAGILAIRRHAQGEILTLAEASYMPKREEALAFKASVVGERLEWELAGVELNAMDSLYSGPGHVGVMARDGSLLLDALSVQAEGRTLLIPEKDPVRPRKRALQDFAILLMNLNEFLYVD